MADQPQIPIIKAHTDDGGDDGHGLKNCYFQEVEEGSKTFKFFTEHGTPIPTYVGWAKDHSPVAKDDTFSFTYNDLVWIVTEFHISEGNLEAHGHWSAYKIPPGLDNTDENPETGTFQAQGGNNNYPKANALASS